MLTVATITPEQGEQYYQQENYYSKNAAMENSEWWGKGAAALGLRGQISESVAHKNLVHGFSPDGSQPLRDKPRNKETKERAGVDLTFSAPKSVSLACLVGGDSRLESAHRLAVKRTLEIIERRYAETRVKGERISTGNLSVAMWHHDTSREYDPHLHTHCVLMNATQLPNGKWQSRTDESLYYNKILLGRIYRNELALECRQLGYEIEAHPKELFEIKGYTREQLEAFSKRHEQILDKLADVGAQATTENKIWAWRQTRVKKNHEIDRLEMLPYWHEEADLYGLAHPGPNQNPQIAPALEVEAELMDAVKAGIEHCSERQVAFKTEDIEKFVTAEIRPFGISSLQQAISSHPELLHTFDNRFTTQSSVARELATIRLMQLGLNQVESIANPEAVESYLESKTLTQGQREAVLVAATTTDQFIAWQGVAGAGKTYALKELQLMARSYNIKGFAPSAEAAKVLGAELGIEATTVARQLLTKQPDQPQSNQIWIVDEAGLLSAKDAHALLQRANAEQARVILVGDTRQLSAVEAGNPFASLQQAGIKTAYLNESVRQRKGSPDLQKAVKLAAAGEMAAAINHLDQVGRIEQVPQASERAAKIAEQYIKLDPQERLLTLILAGTHAERLAITRAIRERLKSEGSLGYGVEATLLKAKDLTQVQTRYTHYYAVGDVVMPTREYRRSSLHKFQPYVVEAVNRDSLTLSDNSGNTLTVDPMKFRKTVYTRETLEIAVSDRLRWTQNDASLGRRNGQEFTVTGIESNTATIEYKDGKTDYINLYQPLHLDYALVSTTYSSQGKTAEQVLISAAADRTLSQESFNVAISRAKLDLRIYAESTQKLLEYTQSSTAKENPLELLQAPVFRRGPIEQTVRTNPKVERAVAIPYQPSPTSELQSTTLRVEAQSPEIVAPPVKLTDETHERVETSNQPANQPPSNRPTEKQTDMAAIFKAATRKLPDPPEWLAIGKLIHYQNHGWGEVEAIIGARVVVKLDNGALAQIPEWPAAVELKLVTPVAHPKLRPRLEKADNLPQPPAPTQPTPPTEPPPATIPLEPLRELEPEIKQQQLYNTPESQPSLNNTLAPIASTPTSEQQGWFGQILNQAKTTAARISDNIKADIKERQEQRAAELERLEQLRQAATEAELAATQRAYANLIRLKAQELFSQVKSNQLQGRGYVVQRYPETDTMTVSAPVRGVILEMQGQQVVQSSLTQADVEAWRKFIIKARLADKLSVFQIAKEALKIYGRNGWEETGGEKRYLENADYLIEQTTTRYTYGWKHEFTLTALDGRGSVLKMGQSNGNSDFQILSDQLTQKDVNKFQELQKALNHYKAVRQLKKDAELVLWKYGVRDTSQGYMKGYGTYEGKAYQIVMDSNSLRIIALDGRGEILNYPSDPYDYKAELKAKTNFSQIDCDLFRTKASEIELSRKEAERQLKQSQQIKRSNSRGYGRGR